jgi:two-component system uhpT operon response regulator UhpA
MNKSSFPEKQRRFLVVENQPLYSEAVGLLIRDCFPNSEIVRVKYAGEAKAKLQHSQFDLVTMDIELQGCSGFDLLEDCKHMQPPPNILVVSRHTRSDYVTRALKLGALGYVSKSVSNNELEDAIRTVINNRLFLSNDVAHTVAEATIRNHHLPAHAVLRGREFEVFLLLAQGMQPKEIAATLNLSVRTVAVHKLRSFRKTGIRNLVELFQYCQEHRLLKYDNVSQPAA